jgi:hypothetical protein
MVVVNRCWLCETEGESVDHLLLHCVAASCGMLFLHSLICAGLCLVLSKSYLQVGGRVAKRGVQLCEKWSLIALCGVFGGK